LLDPHLSDFPGKKFPREFEVQLVFFQMLRLECDKWVVWLPMVSTIQILIFVTGWFCVRIRELDTMLMDIHKL
jgi:hypothetical protein